MQWQTDTRAENVLKREGISWSYQTVPASEIDVKASLVNRARPVALNYEVCEDYSKAMLDGDVFPAIVLAKIKGKPGAKLTVAGGNHRRYSAVDINGEEAVFALVIEVDEIQFDVVCKSLNSVEGQRADRSLRVAHATDMVFQHSASVNEAADKMRVSRSAVQASVRAEQARAAAMRLGVSLNGNVPKSHLYAIARHTDDDNILKPLSELVRKGVGKADLDELLDEVNKGKTEAQRISSIERFSKDRTPEKRSVTRTELSKLMEAFGRIERLAKKNPTAKQMQVTSENRAEVVKRWEVLKASLDEILMAGSRR